MAKTYHPETWQPEIPYPTLPDVTQGDEDAIPSMGQLLQLLAPNQPSLRGLVKIGEGTYGEAFKHAGNVFKIVPIEGTAMINNAAQKNAAEMAAELAVAFALTSLGRPGGVNGGFAWYFRVAATCVPDGMLCLLW